MQTKTVNADDAGNNINRDGHSPSPDEVNITSQSSVKSVADGVSLKIAGNLEHFVACSKDHLVFDA